MAYHSVSIALVSNTQQLFTDFKTSLTLMAANGTSITKYGTAISLRTIQLNGYACERSFTSAQTSVPLLGGDFLTNHGLIVVLKHGRLAGPEAIMAVQPQCNPVQQPVNTSLVNNTYTRLTGSVTSSALSSDSNVEWYPRTGYTILPSHHHIRPRGVLPTSPLGPSKAAACYNVIPRNGSHGSVY